jgi:hypothetical protein
MGVTKLRLPPSDVQHLNFVEARKQGRRIILLEQVQANLPQANTI